MTGREAEWARAWLLRDVDLLPGAFARYLVMIGESSVWGSEDPSPFTPIDPNDSRLDEERQLLLDAILADVSGHDCAASAVLYGGYSSSARRLEIPFSPPLELTPLQAPRLLFFLAGGRLGELVPTDLAPRLGGFAEVSGLWPNDRAWCVASPPDLSATIIGCDDELALRLLGTPALDAREWVLPDGLLVPRWD